ncbi:isochorismate synthase [Pseudothauera rhizosphaerae]|uniref:isochorismate synthase n=1 Tax=Pseudothauera rhizosphaerae TaxID=2565932 RepID=A0A4S4AAG7_9RHOO|nr:isochorismate synthase [Pseudothauera rhizosphaerae]THF55621.1 isochorismate synthase [Pseudothauera rhizosphaerae]
MNDVIRGVTDARARLLLEDYRAEDPFFFATAEHTLLARGCYATVPPAGDLVELSQVVDEQLQAARRNGHPNPIVVGAVPFDARRPACLSIPREVSFAGPLERGRAATWRPERYEVRPEPEPQAYADAVAEAVRRIRAGGLTKVVLARTLALTGGEAVDVPGLLERLAQRNTHGYTFAARLGGEGGEGDDGAAATLVGASPELLVSRRGLLVRSNPLAGSAARSGDAAEDARRGQALLGSAKDLHEHKVVADAVAAGLRPHCRRLAAPAAPALLHTATMLHLSSDIRGELAEPAANTLRLAASLHPTPAVCGHPGAAAFDLIGRLDAFDRGFYAGLVGWCDADGNGEWVVALRCAEVQGKRMRLFAGAGIVADSDPHSEVAETGAKFRTMLNAIGHVPEGAL